MSLDIDDTPWPTIDRPPSWHVHVERLFDARRTIVGRPLWRHWSQACTSAPCPRASTKRLYARPTLRRSYVVGAAHLARRPSSMTATRSMCPWTRRIRRLCICTLALALALYKSSEKNKDMFCSMAQRARRATVPWRRPITSTHNRQRRRKRWRWFVRGAPRPSLLRTSASSMYNKLTQTRIVRKRAGASDSHAACCSAVPTYSHQCAGRLCDPRHAHSSSPRYCKGPLQRSCGHFCACT